MLLLFLVVTASGTAYAQSSKERKNARQRTEKMAERLAKELKLDDETTEWFKPIYLEMQDTLRAVRRQSRMSSRNQKPEELTEEQASKLIEATFAATEQEVALKRTYCKKLGERLKAGQLLRLFAAPAPRFNNNHRMPQGRGGFPGGPGGFPGGGLPEGSDF